MFARRGDPSRCKRASMGPAGRAQHSAPSARAPRSLRIGADEPPNAVFARGPPAWVAPSDTRRMTKQPSGQASTPRPSNATTTITAVTYRAWGPICGGCQHRHRSVVTAQRCCDAHYRDVMRRYLGGVYPDRDPVRWDGRPLDDAERRELATLYRRGEGRCST